MSGKISSKIQEIVETLHPLEQKVINLLKDNNKLSELANKTNMDIIETMRALQWLSNKEILTLNKIKKEIIEIDENGKKYLEKGLPERQVLELVKKGKDTIQKLEQESDMSKQEIGFSLGILKKKALIDLEKGKIIINQVNADKYLNDKSIEEKFMEKVSKQEIDFQNIKEEDKFCFDNLIKRQKIIKKTIKKDWGYELTELGKELTKSEVKFEARIDRLTPQMLKDGSFKDKKFRKYDIKAKVAPINTGKRHFVNQALDYAKNIWIEMGFTEMTGNLTDTSFWVFDALFTPQDHPVREMQDTFFIKNPKYGKLPKDKEVIKKVKEAHEGNIDGSKGWNYKWDEKIAQQNVMRTHTTVLSARTLAMLKQYKDQKRKGKYFALGRNYRNETLDWSHLFEFNQTEGIVIDPNANFSNLLGYLKQFFKKMGYEQARFRPAFFSYTEPSIEIDVYHPVHKKWLELGGAGMFRPEVVIPLLGEDIPVLAWGPGYDRIYLEYYGINDIRDLFKNDLKQLREMKAWMK
jgi:phenylalanyl-tRNA synthetase alpha chain